MTLSSSVFMLLATKKLKEYLQSLYQDHKVIYDKKVLLD